jgi:transcriptional regulator with XRE-family HTH domain
MSTQLHETLAMMILAQNVKQMRTERGLTQKDLADAIGVDHPRISEIERKVGNPTLSTIEKLAGFFGVSAGFLIDGKKTAQN